MFALKLNTPYGWSGNIITKATLAGLQHNFATSVNWAPFQYKDDISFVRDILILAKRCVKSKVS